MSEKNREPSVLVNPGEEDLFLDEEDLLNPQATDDLDREGAMPQVAHTADPLLLEGEDDDPDPEVPSGSRGAVPKPMPWESPGPGLEEELPKKTKSPRAPGSEGVGDRPGGMPRASPSSGERPTEASGEKTPEGDAGQESAQGCAVIGPSKVGKTSLLLAMETACTLLERGQPELRFIPRGETPELIKTAIKVLKGESVLEGTTKHAEYEFDIQAGHHEPLHIRVEDGPGGALFPDEARRKRRDGSEEVVVDPNFEDWEATMVEKVAGSRHLILCVDASAPRSDLWRTYLPRLVGKLVEGRPEGPVGAEESTADVSSEDQESWRVKLRRFWGRGPRNQVVRRRARSIGHGLPFERVLVLLTKMDQFAADALDQLTEARDWLNKQPTANRESTHASLVHLTELTPEDLLRRLAPVDQAREILGASLLQRIRSAMSPSTQIAVGLSSAGGFKRDGHPFFGSKGTPERLLGVSQEDVLRHWVPFGVREAMLFMATGEPNHLVELLTPEHLYRERDDEASDIATSEFGSV